MSLIGKLTSTNAMLTIVFFIALSFNQFFGNQGIFPIDSFGFFDTGFRILNGESPFNDYWLVSGPLIDYTQAFLFLIFGVNWQVYVLNASILNGVFAVLTCKLFLDFKLTKKFSFFYTISLAVLAYPISGTPFVDQHSTFLSIISVYLLILAIKTEKQSYWFFLPFFLGFAFLSKQVPATYVGLSIVLLIFYNFIFNNKIKNFKILLTLTISTIIFFIILALFFYINGISIQNFIEQYINYPREIGQNRYLKLNYNFKNVIMDFKFIYLVFILLLIININKLFKYKEFYKKINFKLFLISFLLLASLIQHQILTKNQIFIFFLIPLFSAFVHIELLDLNNKYKKYLIFLLVFMCVFTTFKYHFRFNVERKFHELNNVDFSNSIKATILDKKFKGLNWITPGKNSKKELLEEIKSIKEIINILKEDKQKKMLITNYSFFSVLLDESVNGITRWYPGNDSAFPTKENKSYNVYKKFLLKQIQDKKIVNVYIISDVSEKNLLDYLRIECVNKKEIYKHLSKYEINRKCSDFYGKQ